jgi:hypothetical protein
LVSWRGEPGSRHEQFAWGYTITERSIGKSANLIIVTC